MKLLERLGNLGFSSGLEWYVCLCCHHTFHCTLPNLQCFSFSFVVDGLAAAQCYCTRMQGQVVYWCLDADIEMLVSPKSHMCAIQVNLTGYDKWVRVTDARNASRYFLQLPMRASGAWVASAAHLDRLISQRLTTRGCATLYAHCRKYSAWITPVFTSIALDRHKTANLNGNLYSFFGVQLVQNR